MAVVDIVIPSYRGLRPAAWTTIAALMRANECQCDDARTGQRLHTAWECRRKHSLFLNPHTQSCIIHWARNQGICQALWGPHPQGRPPAEWFLLLDDDMLMEPHYLPRLLAHRVDLVAGICTVRRDPPIPNIRFWRPDLKAFVEPVEWDWESQKLIEVDAVGAACMLVRRRVLERMAEAYLDCFFEREEDRRKFSPRGTPTLAVPGSDKENIETRNDNTRTESREAFGADVDRYWNARERERRERFERAQKESDHNKMDCWWFQMLSNVVDGQVGELGEDLSFCWKAKKLGFRIFADPQVLPGHLGEYGYSVRDWIYFVEQRKALGEGPKETGTNQVGL